MRSLLKLFAVVSICVFYTNPFQAEIGFSDVRHRQVAEHFDPFNISYEEMGVESMPGTTIVSNYAGSGHFFFEGSLWNSAGQIAQSPDSVGASVFLFPNDTSRYLYARDFGLDIPCNATITNITFRVSRQNNSLVDVADALVTIYNPLTFSPGALNLKDPSVWIEGGTNWETIIYSHSNWGETITPELINNQRFGLIIQVEQLLTAGLALPIVDAVELEVCYNVGVPYTSPIVFVSEKVDACFNEGSITISASGGSGTYEYSIDGGTSWTSNPVFGNLALGEYILTVRNNDGTCQTEILYCNLSGDERILQAGDAIVACATFPGNLITLAIEKLQPMNDLYLSGERGYDISFLLPNHPYEWTVDDLHGEVFSFDIDKSRNIYTATTMLYDLVPGGAVLPIVSKIDAFSGAVQVLDTLPGDAGATGVEYDTICQQLFVANLSDGIIYRIDPDTGLTLSTYDPGIADNGASGMSPLGERVFGMGYNPTERKLYYAIWASDFDRTGIRNTIRSISIDPGSCAFLPGTDQLEITLPWTSEYGDPLNPLDFSMPVGDIEFSTDGNTMLVGESGFDSTVPASKPHESRVLRYIGSSSSWTLQTTAPPGNYELQHELGEVSAGFNARGGVDFANSGFDSSNCGIDNDEYIIATADALRGADCNSIGCLYGLQYLPVTGGNSAGSVLLDIARDINSQQKSVFGDVDWVQGCHEPLYCCPDIDTPNGDQGICRNETLTAINLNTKADSLVIVYFTNVPQDSPEIYSGGVSIDTVEVISDAAASGLSGLPTNVPGTYYVYARVHPTPENENCQPYDSIVVTIYSDPTPTIDDPADRCVNAADMLFTATPAPAGLATGTFSTTATGGLTDNGNGTASLDVSAAGAGSYDVNYTYTDLNGCVATTTSSITILDLPSLISITDPNDECIDGNLMLFTGTPIPSGGNTGVFSTTAPSGMIVTGFGTASLDPAAAGPGTFNVFYTYTTTDGCTGSDVVSITIYDLPTVSINDPDDECVIHGPMLFTGSPLPSLGISGVFGTNAPAGFTDNGNGTASLDVGLAGEGSYTVSYTYTDNNGCVNSANAEVEIFDTLENVILVDIQVCGDPVFGNNVLDLNSLIQSGPLTGSWSDTDATGALSGSVFTAHPGLQGNSYNFTYTLSGTGPAGTDCHQRDFIAIVDVLYCNLDLALIKNTSQSLPVQSGDLVSYDITICNQGYTNVDSIEITDYIPSCYLFSDNNGWVGSGNEAVKTMTITNGQLPTGGLLSVDFIPNNCITVPIELTINCGDTELLINYAEITASRDVDGNTDDLDSNPGTNSSSERDVRPGDPEDDSFTDVVEDDHDPGTMPIADISLVKTLTTNGPYDYGQSLFFDIELTNQGNIGLRNVEVTDYIPCGFQYSSNNNTTWSLTGSTAKATISNLPAGGTENLSIELVILEYDGTCSRDSAWINEAEVSRIFDDTFTDISIYEYDSNINDIQGDDAGGASGTASDNSITGNGSGNPGDNLALTDEDDHDPHFFQVYDLSLDKTVTSTGPYGQDSIVSYIITIENQGNLTANNVEVTEVPHTGLLYVSSDAGLNGNVNETSSGIWAISSLAPGDLEIINVTYQIASNFQGINLTNEALITLDDGDDIDSDPDSDNGFDEDGDGDGDDDDEDSETIDIDQFYDLALIKNEISTGPYYQNSLITYELTVINEGTQNASNIRILDDPDVNLVFVSDNASSNPNVSAAGGLTYDISSLPIGASESLELTFRVDALYQDSMITNVAEIILDDGNDNDSDPSSRANVDEDNDGDGDDDDEDSVSLHVDQHYDLSIQKTTLGSGPYTPGDFIVYQIQMENEGTLNANNIEITEEAGSGLIFVGDDSALNPNVSSTGPTTYEISALPFGTTETLEITFQVAPGFQGTSVENIVQITADDGNDIDSDPDRDEEDDENEDGDGYDDDEDNEVTPVNQTYDLSIDKRLTNTGPFLPGSSLTFEITVINEGTLNASNIAIEENPDAGLIFNASNAFINSNVTENSGNSYTVLSLLGGQSESFRITYDLDPAYLQPFIGNNVQIVADDGNDMDSNPGLDYNTDEDTDGNGFDDDEDRTEVTVIIGYDIGNYVWHDLDGDGIQDSNEPGLPGVVVDLYDEFDYFIARTVSDQSGLYLFEEVFPSNYYLKVKLPENYIPTLYDKGSNDGQDNDIDEKRGPGTSAVFTIDDDDYSRDIGFIKCARICGNVWFDYDEDDKLDDFENGINQMKVELYRWENGEWIIWDITYTGHKPGTGSDDGYYKFCTTPGTYYLKFVNPPTTLVPVVPNIGFFEDKDSDVTGRYGPGTTNQITVDSDEEICNVDAGYYVMGTAGDYVWYDDNNNGMRDAGEQGVEGAKVLAIDIEGDMVSYATTDIDGRYMIDYLGKNTYYLQFNIPPGFTMTQANRGGDDSMDSDADGSNGLNTTKWYNILPGEHLEHVDAGIVAGALPVVWEDVWGENRNTFNYIEWTTHSEWNLSHFEIERSINGIDAFANIGKVVAEESSSTSNTYHFEDYNLDVLGAYYYRIKQVDLNGQYEYSRIVSVKVKEIKNIKEPLILFPNPVIRELTASLYSPLSEGQIYFKILDASGRLILDQKKVIERSVSGHFSFKIDVKKLEAGVYTIQVWENQEQYIRKLIVIK